MSWAQRQYNIPNFVPPTNTLYPVVKSGGDLSGFKHQ